MPNNYITLSQLTKTTKGLVNKINAEQTITNNKIGNLTNLNTTAKTDLVAAINEAAASGTSYDDTALVGRVTALENAGYITSYTETDPVFTASAAAGISSTDITNWNAKSDFSGSYNDLEDKPTIPNVPTWALESTKPTYTASEVGAASTSDLSNYVKKSTTKGTIEHIISSTGSTGSFGDEVVTKIGGQSQNSSSSFRGIQITTWYAQSKYKTNLNLTGLTTTISADSILDIGKTGVSTMIRGIITPTSDDMAANKKYVDDSVSAISVPTKTSDLTNDSGYLTSYTETDPTVPSWAKQTNKPTYTAAEVGALPDTYTAPVTSVNGETGNIIVSKIKTTPSDTNVEYNLIGTAGNNNTTAVSPYNQNLLSFAKTTDFSRLTIGSTSVPGKIRLYSSANSASGYTELKSNSSSTNTREVVFPDASGTVALTTDIPSVPSWALTSSKPSYTFSELTSHPTTLNDYGITNAYTKTEVDGLVSGVLHYKGTKATVSALPSSGNVTGDVWHITADGSEWAWDGSDWQELGTAVDLSGYLQTGDIAAWAKAANKPTYTASEVGALSSSTTYVSSFNGQSGAITYVPPVSSVNGQTGVVELTIPSDTSDLTNGAGFLTSFTETDPTVPSWAKASTKPSYTANEVGAASAAHAHGSITSDGAITENTALASSDRLVFADNSDSGKLKRSSITFGSSTTQYLANDGTWQNAYDDTALAARVSALEQIPWVTYYTGSSTPSNSQGNNGDLYFQTAQ